MAPNFKIHSSHDSPVHAPYGQIPHCVSFYCSDCGREILNWVPSFTAHPEKLGWCDACWAKREHGRDMPQRKAA